MLIRIRSRQTLAGGVAVLMLFVSTLRGQEPTTSPYQDPIGASTFGGLLQSPDLDARRIALPTRDGVRRPEGASTWSQTFHDAYQQVLFPPAGAYSISPPTGDRQSASSTRLPRNAAPVHTPPGGYPSTVSAPPPSVPAVVAPPVATNFPYPTSASVSAATGYPQSSPDSAAYPYMPNASLTSTETGPGNANAPHRSNLYLAERLEAPQQAAPLTPSWSAPSQTLDAPQTWGEPVFEPVAAHKNSCFQKLSYIGTWISRGGQSDFGLYESQLSATFAVPMPTIEHPLLIIPGYNERYFSGPIAPDIPERVIDAYVEFMWLPKLNERWSFVAAISPGVYSDMEDGVDEAFRLTGKGLARWNWDPGRLQLVFGVLYLDRVDIAVLPAGGLIWTPHNGARYDLVCPSPKAAWRIRGESGQWEDWFYVAGEFGGDQWSVQRSGIADTMTLREVRLSAGLDRRLPGGAGFRVEAGYVLGRIIEFGSATPDYEASDAAMIRFAVTF